MSKLNAQVLVTKYIFQGSLQILREDQGKNKVSTEHTTMPENKEVLERMMRI